MLWKLQKMDVLWRCPKCNGEYRYSIAERKVGDDSCPYCQGRKRFIFLISRLA
ncbi:hypothetical protein DXB50_05515 [Butyricicoccus sp. OM04-18BH]|nr:hypothetical protein DXB50_05515 [Butyricicoccus sp. OM04-18BH]